MLKNQIDCNKNQLGVSFELNTREGSMLEGHSLMKYSDYFMSEWEPDYLQDARSGYLIFLIYLVLLRLKRSL